MTPDQPVDRHAVHAEVRKAIAVLVAIGSLEALPPAELARVGAAASKFTGAIAGIARRGGRGHGRGKGQRPVNGGRAVTLDQGHVSQVTGETSGQGDISGFSPRAAAATVGARVTPGQGHSSLGVTGRAAVPAGDGGAASGQGGGVKRREDQAGARSQLSIAPAMANADSGPAMTARAGARSHKSTALLGSAVIPLRMGSPVETSPARSRDE